jgi:S1-C subfamily serine protease
MLSSDWNIFRIRIIVVEDCIMRRIMILALCFLTFQSITLGQTEIPRPDAVPFLGLEDVASKVKKAVFAVQVMDDSQQWRPLGSGFLVGAEPNVLLGVTCAHVVSAAEKANKPTFIGINTDKGYKAFQM